MTDCYNNAREAQFAYWSCCDSSMNAAEITRLIESRTYTRDEIDALIADIDGLTTEEVQEMIDEAIADLHTSTHTVVGETLIITED